METTTYTGSTRSKELVVNHVSYGQPLEWLAKGWKDVREAGRYSLRYGAGIVLIVGLGLITSYVGLIVALPLVGHGTWHAYRDLVPLSE